jgi:hypothetical protein
MGRTACTEPQCLYKGDLYLFLTMLEPNAAAQHYEDPVESDFLSNMVQISGPQVSPTWTNHPF